VPRTVGAPSRERDIVRSLTGLILVAAVLGAAACGGGASDDRTAGIIHRLLLAAGVDDAGSFESFVGALPDDLPVDVPQYPGADLIVSSQQPAPLGGLDDPPADAGGNVPEPVLYFIVLDTDDERDKVLAFYEQELDADPWQLESSFSTAQLDTLQFVNVRDTDISGAVSIARGGDDDRTSILISLQDAGAFREEALEFELDESLPAPKEFPADVPLYENGTITGTAFFREPGSESFLIIFLTTDSQDAVIAFYREAFEERGWTVTDGEPFGLEERIDFNDDALDIQGELIADRFPQARDYTEVRLQVQLDPARAPPDEETPVAESTPQE